jgi:hypothetical protein
VIDARGRRCDAGRTDDLRREQQAAFVHDDQTGKVLVAMSKRLRATIFQSGFRAAPTLRSICVLRRSLTPCIRRIFERLL